MKMKKAFFVFWVLIPSLLSAGGGSNIQGILDLQGYSTSDSVGVNAVRTRGDYQEQSPLTTDDCMLHLKAFGYNGTNITSSPAAKLSMNAAQTWTTTANGTDIRFFVTPNGSTTLGEAMRISSNSWVGIGTTNPSVALDVVGAIKASGAVTFGVSALLSATSATITNQQLWGTGAAISTFTPTALTLDDGVTFTNNGTSALNGNVTVGASAILAATTGTFSGALLIPANAAPRTNVIPPAAGYMIRNTDG